MKKYISFFTILFCFSGMQSQEISASDALRYALDNTNGTSRFRAMSGAFGALGGDMSAINVNPAGSAIFANNQITVTASNYNIKNNSSYFGTKASENTNAFDLNQAGAVFVFENNTPETNWKKLSLAINYENQNNFDNSIFSAGTNPLHSGTQYFINFANGIPLSDLQDFYYDEFGFDGQQAWLGYQSYLINPDDENNSNNFSYHPNVVATGNYYQESEILSTGYNGKLSFNAAAQYGNNFFIGLNLNSHFTDFRKSTTFYEDYYTATNASSTQGIQSFRFNNDVYTYGNGFSFQLGAILKVTNELRVGIAYESPTWLTLNDELSQSISTYCADCVDNNGNALPPNQHLNPEVINTYAPYKVQTPNKWTTSFAYVFGKQGLLSFDYSLKDYSSTSFRPKNDIVFNSLNNIFLNTAREKTSEYRIGGEYKIKLFSLRAGYRFEQSPYKNAETVGNLTGYSGGLGYNFGSTKLDLSYSTAKRNYSEQFLSSGMTDKATIDSKNNNFTLTLAFEL
jgi:hypothetical protein